PDVEIAAPVASVGLFTARERTFMYPKDPTTMHYYAVEYSTSDGVHTYLKDTEWIIDLGTSIKNASYYPSSMEVLHNNLGDDAITFLFPTSYHQVVAVDAKEEEKLTNFKLDLLDEKN